MIIIGKPYCIDMNGIYNRVVLCNQSCHHFQFLKAFNVDIQEAVCCFAIQFLIQVIS